MVGLIKRKNPFLVGPCLNIFKKLDFSLNTDLVTFLTKRRACTRFKRFTVAELAMRFFVVA